MRLKGHISQRDVLGAITLELVGAQRDPFTPRGRRLIHDPEREPARMGHPVPLGCTPVRVSLFGRGRPLGRDMSRQQ